MFVFVILVLPATSTSFTFYTMIVVRVSCATFYAIWIHYITAIRYYQFAYFTILCYYLHLKLSQINRRLVNKEKNIYRIKTELTTVYEEISHYNSNYWAKFLLVIYSTLSSLIAMITFISIVAGIENPYMKAMFLSYAVGNTVFLLKTLKFSSLIYNDCKYSYHHLNSYVHSVKGINLRNKIKVKSSI